jgi:carbon-monoxide dehydrogenase iron sulfur subunit
VPKVIQCDPLKCTGCKTCEAACSLKHLELVNPAKARLHNYHYLLEDLNIVLTCLQCDEPFCAATCPVYAISKDPDTGIVKVTDKCVGCQMCAVSCPYGHITYHMGDKKASKCEQCDGEPECVALCPTGALSYVEKDEGMVIRGKSVPTDLDFVLKHQKTILTRMSARFLAKRER